MNALGNAIPHPPSACRVGDMVVDELSVLWKVVRLHMDSSMVDVQKADNHMRHSRIDLNDVQQVYRPKRMVTCYETRIGGEWQGDLKRMIIRNDPISEDGGHAERVVRSLNRTNHTETDCDYDYQCRISIAPMAYTNKRMWIATFMLEDLSHPVAVPLVVRPFERTCVLFGRAVAGDLRITTEISSIDEDTMRLTCWVTREDGMVTWSIDGDVCRRTQT